jgi:membrane protease YdiL (CAAX protease family)
MLFLLKRTSAGAVLGLLALSLVGLALRAWRDEQATPWGLSGWSLLLGVAVCVAVVASDGLLHGTLLWLGGATYRRRYQALAALFGRQSVAALFLGSLMAGVGEELVFRGLGTAPAYLIAAAVLFGLLHHVRAELWPFTLWSIWEGALFALALWLTGALVVTMTAHFLHDAVGFLIFRLENAKPWECTSPKRE